MHRYRFPKGKPAHVLVDLRTSMYDYPGKVLWSRLRLRPDGTVTGFRETRGWAPGRQLYFAMRFSRPVSGHQFHDTEQDVAYKGFPPPGEKDPRQRAQIEGRQLVGALDFADAAGQSMIVKVAISPVSEDSAIANLDAEVPAWDFDGVRRDAKAQWAQALGAVDIDAPEPMRRSFYTALYHTLHGAEPVHGQRRPLSRSRQRRAPGQGLHALLDLLAVGHLPRAASAADAGAAGAAQQRLHQFAARLASPQSIRHLPVWSFHGQETWCMIGYHAVPVIADAYMKGIRGYDADEALQAMVASASYGPYDGIAQYMQLGYVPIDEEGEAASKTLEYAFDDWTIARMAEAMGRKDVAAQFGKRAANWRNAFDPKTGFMRARKRDGNFREPFDPSASGYGTDYTEGNAWQYSWYVPQDVAGLAAAHGGDGPAARPASTRCSTPRSTRRSSSTWKTSPA